MVTHDDRAAARADRIVEVRDGRILPEATDADEFASPIATAAQDELSG
jgi:ABC-type lipoprotein export system ATPase subunit